jgi:DNA polymerase-3 subunit delta
MATKSRHPPVIVIFGDEEYQKASALQRTLDALLPPEADRTLALCPYDGSQAEDQGGPAFASVMDDLATLPLLAPRRVVLIREADRFITAYRERLEKYLAAPAGTATLILECRSFPRTTRLYKAVAGCGGEIVECKKLTGRALADFVVAEARARGQRIDPDAARRLCELVGAEQGALASEVEKLCLYAHERPAITSADVAELVGQSREEKIFRVMDAAGLGRLPEALALWQQVLATDPAAGYRAVGGMAFVLRRWMDAQRQRADGVPTHAIAPKLLMWGREGDVETILRRLPARRLGQLLAAVGELDSQAKSGTRSIETGVETLLVSVAAPTT